MLINFINQATYYKQPFKSAFSKLYSKYQKLSKNQKISLISATAISSSLAFYVIISSKKGKTAPAIYENSKKPEKTSSIRSVKDWDSKLNVAIFSRLGLPFYHFINPQAKFAYLEGQISNPTIPSLLKKELIEKLNPLLMPSGISSKCNELLLELMENNTLEIELRLAAANNIKFCEESLPGKFKQFISSFKGLYEDINDQEDKDNLLSSLNNVLDYYCQFSKQPLTVFLEVIQNSSYDPSLSWEKEKITNCLHINLKNKKIPYTSPSETLQQLQALIKDPLLHNESQVDIELKRQINNTMLEIVKKHLELFPVFAAMSIELFKDQLIHQDIKKEILIVLSSHSKSDKLSLETLKQLQALIKEPLLHNESQVDIELKRQINNTMLEIVKKHLELFPVFAAMSIELFKDQLIHQDIKKEILIVLSSHSKSDKLSLETLKQLQALIKEPLLHNESQVDIELKRQINNTMLEIVKKHLELFPVLVAMSTELLKDQLIHQDIKKEILIQLWLYSESDKEPLETLKQLQALIKDPLLHNESQVDIKLKKQIAHTMLEIVKKHLELFPVFVAMSTELLKDQLIHQDIKKEILIQLWLYSESDKEPLETLKQLQALIKDPLLHNESQVDIELKRQINNTMLEIVKKHLELFPVFAAMSIELLKDQLIHQDIKKEILVVLPSHSKSDKLSLETLKQLQALIKEPLLHNESQVDIELKRQINNTMLEIVKKHLELFPVFVAMSTELLKDQLIHQDIKKEILIQLWLYSESDKEPLETLKQLQTLIKDPLLHNESQVDIKLKKQIAHTMLNIVKKHLELFPVFAAMSIELFKDQLIHQDIKKEILVVLSSHSKSDKLSLETLKQLQALIKEPLLHNDPQVDIELKKQIAHTMLNIVKKHLELFPVFVTMSIELFKDQLIHQDIKKEILIQLWLYSESDKEPLETLKQLQAIIRSPQLHDDPQVDIELKKQIAHTMLNIAIIHLELFPVFAAMSIELLKDQLIHQDIKKEILVVLPSHSKSDKLSLETLKQLQTLIKDPLLHNDPQVDIDLKKQIAHTMLNIVKKHLELFPVFVTMSIELFKDQLIQQDIKKEILIVLPSHSKSDKLSLETLKQLQALIKEPLLHNDPQVDIDLKKQIAHTMLEIVKKHLELFPVFAAMSIELLKDQLIHQDIKKEILVVLPSHSKSDKLSLETLKQLQTLIKDPLLHNDPQVDIDLKKQIAHTMLNIAKEHLELFPVFVTMSIELLKDQLIHQDIKKEILIQLWLHTGSDKEPLETLKQLQTLIKDLLLHDDPQVDIELKKQIAQTISWTAKKHLELFPVFVTMSIELFKDQLIHQDIKKEILIELWLHTGSDKQPIETLKQLQALIKEPLLHNESQVDIELKKQITHTMLNIVKKHLELFPELLKMFTELIKDSDLLLEAKTDLKNSVFGFINEWLSQFPEHKELLLLVCRDSELHKETFLRMTVFTELFDIFSSGCTNNFARNFKGKYLNLVSFFEGLGIQGHSEVCLQLKKDLLFRLQVELVKSPEHTADYYKLLSDLIKNSQLDIEIRQQALNDMFFCLEPSYEQALKTSRLLAPLVKDSQLHSDREARVELKKGILDRLRHLPEKYPELIPIYLKFLFFLCDQNNLDEEVKIYAKMIIQNFHTLHKYPDSIKMEQASFLENPLTSSYTHSRKDWPVVNFQGVKEEFAFIFQFA